MRFVIVTGMSGAGKSSALKMLEDVGYFCVDNLPVALLDKFAEMLLDKTAKIENAALGIDIRNGEGIGELEQKLKEIKEAGIKYEILYLNASNRILLKRYHEIFTGESGLCYRHKSASHKRIKRGDQSHFC